MRFLSCEFVLFFTLQIIIESHDFIWEKRNRNKTHQKTYVSLKKKACSLACFFSSQKRHKNVYKEGLKLVWHILFLVLFSLEVHTFFGGVFSVAYSQYETMRFNDSSLNFIIFDGKNSLKNATHMYTHVFFKQEKKKKSIREKCYKLPQ